MSQSNQYYVDQLNWRYATKAFDPTQKLSESQWKTLESSLHLSASSFGLQPWKFIVVQNPEIRAELKPVSFGQGQITDASHLVVFTTLRTMDEAYISNFINTTASVRNIDVATLKGYQDMMTGFLIQGDKVKNIPHWAQRQAYIAMGTLLSTAAYINVDTCPIEGISTTDYDRILGLEGTPYQTVAVVAIGFRASDDKYQHAAKVRFPIEDVVTYV